MVKKINSKKIIIYIMGILRFLNNLVLAGARNLSPSSLFNHLTLLEKKS